MFYIHLDVPVKRDVILFFRIWIERGRNKVSERETSRKGPQIRKNSFQYTVHTEEAYIESHWHQHLCSYTFGRFSVKTLIYISHSLYIIFRLPFTVYLSSHIKTTGRVSKPTCTPIHGNQCWLKNISILTDSAEKYRNIWVIDMFQQKEHSEIWNLTWSILCFLWHTSYSLVYWITGLKHPLQSKFIRLCHFKIEQDF